MKLYEILSEQDDATDSRFHKKWSPEELGVLLPEVEKTSFTKEEMQDMAKEFAVRYQDKFPGRTVTGIQQILQQLHAIVYGEFPESVVIHAGNWQEISDSVARFAQSRGYDNVREDWEQAREDMLRRVEADRQRKAVARQEQEAISKRNVEQQLQRYKELGENPAIQAKNWIRDNLSKFPKEVGRNPTLRSNLEKLMKDEIAAGQPVDRVGKQWARKLNDQYRQQFQDIQSRKRL